MPDILNAGAIVLVATFGLVAVVGGAQELREQAGPGSSLAGLDDGSAPEAVDTGRNAGVALPMKQTFDKGDRDGRDDDDRWQRPDKGDDKREKGDDDEEEDDD